MIHAPVEPGARAFQGLHRDAQVQHVPVTAYDGDRPGGQAGRGADPHPRDAPRGRVRHRGALALQAGHGRRQVRARTTWAGCANSGVAAGDRGPGRVPRLTALRPRVHRGVRVHPARATSWRCPAGRRHWTSPTRCTPRWGTAASVPGSTASSYRWNRLSSTVRLSRCSRPRPRVPGRAGTGSTSSRAPGRRARSRPGSPRSGGRRRRAVAGTCSQGDAQGGCAGAAAAVDCSLSAMAADMRYADITALYRRSGRAGCRPRRSSTGWCSPTAAAEGAAEDVSESVSPRRGPANRRRVQGDPGIVVDGDEDVWVKLAQLLHTCARRRDQRLRDPGQRGVGAPRGLRERGRAAGAGTERWCR